MSKTFEYLGRKKKNVRPESVFRLKLLSRGVCRLQIISYDSPRGGVNVVTEKGTVTTSHLLIQEARVEDNGRYQCNPSNAQPKSINVHVLNGKRLKNKTKFVFPYAWAYTVRPVRRLRCTCKFGTGERFSSGATRAF